MSGTGEMLAATAKARRKELGLSQGALAESADVSRPTVARLEAGQEIAATSLSKIAAALGMRIALIPDR